MSTEATHRYRQRLDGRRSHERHAANQVHCGSQGLPDTKVGSFTQALYDEAKKKGWTVISMKNDWKRIFAFEP